MKRWKAALATLVCILILPAAGGADVGFRSYFSGDPESPKIAITVDDLFGLDHLESMLDLCLTYDIRMTFFPLGCMIKPEDAALWQRIVDEGHEIGNHTYQNQSIETIETYQLEWRLTRTQDALNAVLREPYPMRLFRPPGGKYDSTGRANTRVLGPLGYQYIILWSVDETDPEKAFRKTRNGSILIFHTNSKDVHCLETLIPMLLDAGFEPVTISELLDLPPMESDIDSE